MEQESSDKGQLTLTYVIVVPIVIVAIVVLGFVKYLIDLYW